MNVLMIILIGIVVLASDTALQVVAPGFVWIAPSALILWLLVQDIFPQRVWFFCVAGLTIDLVSGMPFGVTFVSLCVVFIALMGLHRIARIPRQSVFILAGMHACLLTLFFGFQILALRIPFTIESLIRLSWFIALFAISGAVAVVSWRKYRERNKHNKLYGYTFR